MMNFTKIVDLLKGKKELPKETAQPKVKKPRKPKVKKEAPVLSAKELATQNNEPYIAVLSVDVDPENINSGSFELDWNDKFVLNCVKNGFKLRPDDTDSDIVDRWFQTVCRNIALEVYEQEMADPEKRSKDYRVIQSRDIGNGRSEVS
jgi:hypothetical protein